MMPLICLIATSMRHSVVISLNDGPFLGSLLSGGPSYLGYPKRDHYSENSPCLFSFSDQILSKEPASPKGSKLRADLILRILNPKP